jgi:hypothetical protein
MKPVQLRRTDREYLEEVTRSASTSMASVKNL